MADSTPTTCFNILQLAAAATETVPDSTSSSSAPAAISSPSAQVGLATFPDELILYILKFLDVPELYVLARTSRHLRALSTDPLLHLTRLKTAKQTLNISLSHRPSLDDVQRSGRIYLTCRQVAQRSLARSLTLIRLKRKLSNRPSIPSLIERGVLPAPISPVLLGTVKELEKERVKDMLRGWVGNKRPSLADAERVGWIEKAYLEHERPKVREMATRFTKRCIGGSQRQNSRWGKGGVPRNNPPRAHVLGLRTYYERLTSAV
ncbi:uncharacterized protein H6S33_000548 [Morchella sextelata]|uniref:uncharacterized protein n=1 Tax=Morchella sextelata TaxID=1174677 RepID=UPI001D04C5C6|nr:uncharacterized protein H6S33_000548 [Morchella sextelata]KAH0614912.1 hypothetical protein H6S33_000548 [Morchella sextelata]